MPAIATIHTFGGTGFTGFTELGGGVSESAGALVADNNAVDCGLLRDAAFTEANADAADGTKGTIQKFTLGATPADGSKIRFIVNYVNADNYHYAELHKGGITVFADLKNDRVTMWKRAAGTELQIGSSTPLLYKQTVTGDLRHAKIEAGDAITIMKCLNQYVVKVSATDPYDGRDWEDVIHLSEADGSVVAADEQAGVIFVGGQSHTNSISLWQGGLITCHYVATTGSDANNGSQQSPFLTFKKLFETVDVNEHGWINAGTYNGGVGQGSDSDYTSTLPNGESYEDAPTVMALSGASVLQRGPSAGVNRGCYFCKATDAQQGQYRVLYRWTMSGVDPDTSNPEAAEVIKLYSQATTGFGRMFHHIRFQQIITEQAIGGSNVSCFGLTSATPSDWETYIHWLDCESNDGAKEDAVKETHGWYITTSWNTLEYCQGLRNTGNGGKFLEGANKTPLQCNDNIIRWSWMDQNNKAGWINGTGTDNYAHSNIFSNSQSLPAYGLTTQAVGFILTREAVNNWAWNNLAYGNEDAGFAVWGYLGNQTTGAKFINNTSYGNKWNFLLHTSASPPDAHPDDILFMNNSAYAFTAGGADYSEPVAGSTNVVFTSNHETSNTGFGGTGGVYGDPLFSSVNPADADFLHLQAGSPLIGAGADASAYFTKDFERKPLPQGAWHIGAIAPEFTSGGFAAIRRHRQNNLERALFLA